MRDGLVVAAVLLAALALAWLLRHRQPPLVAEPALPSPPADIAAAVALEAWVTAVEPVALTFARGDPERRLYVVEKPGRVRLLSRGGQFAAPSLVDLSDRVTTSNREQGLLGLAFHPRVAATGTFYLNFTDRKGHTSVVERRLARSAAGFAFDRIDPAYERRLLFVEQPYANHNGGHLAFGPDGRLYVGLGDGGSAGDPRANGQNPSSRLGKMLRIDVDASEPEIEAMGRGLRNPWRYAFDRKSGALWIADVGQDRYEEVDRLAAGTPPGWNLGWNVTEGAHCFRASTCDEGRFIAPVLEYNHLVGCSITGGYVYRGSAIPALDGLYFFADFCTGLLRSARLDGATPLVWDWKGALDPESRLAALASFGEDEAGELYLLSLDGPIYRFVPRRAGDAGLPERDR